MPLIPALASPHLISLACSTGSPSLWSDASISLRKLVTFIAMGGGTFFGYRRRSAKNKSRDVRSFLWRDNRFIVEPLGGSCNDGVGLHSSHFGKIAYAIPRAFNRDPQGTAPIEHLLGFRSPSAVFRGIRTVVVDAVYGMLGRRARQHVLFKEPIGLPPLADRNASSAVIGERLASLVVAALPHAKPDRIQRRRDDVRHTATNSTPCLDMEGGYDIAP